MGLETVELLIEVEETFEITISEHEAAAVATVGELAAVVATKLSEKSYTVVDCEKPLGTIIDMLVDSFAIPRQEIARDSRFVADLGLDQ